MATTTATRAKSASETKKAANNAASVVTKSAAEQTKHAPVSELASKAADLQKQLQAALTELEHKKELNDHRTKFIHTLEQLTAAEHRLDETDDIEGNEPCKISFMGKPDGYRWEALFSIGHPDLQREFIRLIRDKIRAKIETIEAELIK